MEQKKRLGLALGGGGSRALTHLGVIGVLERAGLRIDAVAGSSMGAILGGMYAATRDAGDVRERAVAYFQKSSLFGSSRKPSRNDGLQARSGIFGWIAKYIATASIANWVSLRRSLLRTNPALASVRTLLPDIAIPELPMPYAAVALNLSKGENAVFTSGRLHDAANAATAVGIVYPPYEIGGDLYADAAPISSVPVHAARALGVDVVVAIDIRSPLPHPFPIQHGFDVLRRIESMESKIINDMEANTADILLKPDTGNVFWGDFTNLAPIIAAGETAMNARLDDLRRMLS